MKWRKAAEGKKGVKNEGKKEGKEKIRAGE